MSRLAEVIVLARWAGEVMEPLTRYDERRTWRGCLTPIGTGSMDGWVVEFERTSHGSGLLNHLESLPWPRPESVQVLIHDEEDDCFGMWMIHDHRLVEVPHPHTRRTYGRTPPAEGDPGVLTRTDSGAVNSDLNHSALTVAWRDRKGQAHAG